MLSYYVKTRTSRVADKNVIFSMPPQRRVAATRLARPPKLPWLWDGIGGIATELKDFI